MKNNFTNSLIDLLTIKNKTVFKMWGAQALVAMGDGVKFRVTKSPVVDYVYIRYQSGFELYEVEFGALVGMDYDVVDRVPLVEHDKLIPTISRKVFNFQVVESESVQAPAQT